jgi:hypothetical protein
MEHNLQCIYEELTFKFKKLIITNNNIELKLSNDFTVKILPSDEKFEVIMILFYLSTEVLNSRSIIHKRNIIDTISKFMSLAKNNYRDLLYIKLLQDFDGNDYIIENIMDKNEIKIKLPGNKNYVLIISINQESTKIGLFLDSAPIESVSVNLFSYEKIHDMINFYIDGMRLIVNLDFDI